MCMFKLSITDKMRYNMCVWDGSVNGCGSLDMIGVLNKVR